MPRMVPSVAATALALAFAATALAVPHATAAYVAPMTVLHVIDSDVADPDRNFEAFDSTSLNVADVDGDGHLEVVALNDNLHAYVIDALSGAVRAELGTNHPGGDDSWAARDINGVAVGDVDGDGKPELVVFNSASQLTVFHLAGGKGGDLDYQKLWEKQVSIVLYEKDFSETHPYFHSLDLGADGNPYIGHLSDGKAVIAVQSDGYPGHFVFNADGSLRWLSDYWDGNAGPWIGTLGGRTMAVFATDDGTVVAYNVGSTTNSPIQWTFKAKDFGADPGSMSLMPTVVELASGQQAIFVGARVAVDDHSSDWISRQHAMYFLLDADGKPIWSVQFPWGNPSIYMHPATYDVNGDGTKDIIALDWNTIGHEPGNWEVTGPAQLFALDGATGAELWHNQVNSTWSNKGIVMADFLPNNPGPEIAAEDLVADTDGLALFSMTGQRVGWVGLPAPDWHITRTPVLADLDADGKAEAIVPVAHDDASGCLHDKGVLDVGCRQGALVVYRTQAPNDSVVYSNNDVFDSRQAGPDHLPVATAKPSGDIGSKTTLELRGGHFFMPGAQAAVPGLLAVAAAVARRRSR